MPLTTEEGLQILICWLQDNIDCGTEIIFDNDDTSPVQQHPAPLLNRPRTRSDDTLLPPAYFLRSNNTTLLTR
ncbi:hypothetical protein KCP74_25325 [Salmonella enterica subsp. enterica]|nr:hypothetical protein KCP74_25325 [Salmonella enterica subsp. enterica]